MKSLSILIDNMYKTDNYQEYIYSKGKRAYIFFSSNGIYFPNEYEVAEEALVQQDRYEWKNIANDRYILKNCGKMIFVRDVYKSWYVTGINDKIDSIDKMVKFLEEKCSGYEIVTVGSSAGGYAAVLFGILLNAQKVICYSGQFDLYKNNDVVERYPKLIENKGDLQRGKYYDIVPIIRENKSVPIFYFCPVKCQYDAVQYKLVEKCKCVRAFLMDSDKHGVVLKSENHRYIIGGGIAGLRY